MKVTKTVLQVTMAALLLIGAGAQAAVFTDSPNAAIPVGNPIGYTDSITVSGQLPTISSFSVDIQISGGNNGDLYGYLSYNGVLVTLLNRPGVSGSNPLGFTGSGFNITLTDSGVGNINTSSEIAGAPVTGFYNVNGSAGNGSAAFASAFGGQNPNGTWTLFLANESGGGDPSTLVSWSLDISAVPEPTNVALGIFGICAVAGRVRAGWKKSRQTPKTTDQRI